MTSYTLEEALRQLDEYKQREEVLRSEIKALKNKKQKEESKAPKLTLEAVAAKVASLQVAVASLEKEKEVLMKG